MWTPGVVRKPVRCTNERHVDKLLNRNRRSSMPVHRTRLGVEAHKDAGERPIGGISFVFKSVIKSNNNEINVFG